MANIAEPGEPDNVDEQPVKKPLTKRVAVTDDDLQALHALAARITLLTGRRVTVVGALRMATKSLEDWVSKEERR